MSSVTVSEGVSSEEHGLYKYLRSFEREDYSAPQCQESIAFATGWPPMKWG